MSEESNLIANFANAFEVIQQDFFKLLPNIAGAFLILLAGLLLGFLLRWLTAVLVYYVVRFFPNQFAEKDHLLKNAKSFASGLGNIIFLVTLFLTGISAIKKLGLVVISDWLAEISLHLPKVIAAFLILALSWKLKSFISNFLFTSFHQARVSQAKLMSNAISWFIFTIGLIVAIQQLGIDMKLVVVIMSVLGGVIAGGVALTFALGARETVSNILSCHQIKKHLKAGQKLKHNNMEGIVKSVGPTYVLISTAQGEIIVPGVSFGMQSTIILEGEG